MAVKTDVMINEARAMGVPEWNEVEVFEKELQITKLQLDDFCEYNDVPLESLIQTAWALLLYTYRQTSTVMFCKIRADSNDIDQLEANLDDTKTLKDLCKQAVHGRLHGDDHGQLHDTAIILEDKSHCDGRLRSILPQGNSTSSIAFGLVANFHFGNAHIAASMAFNKQKFEHAVIVGYWHTLEKILQCMINDVYQTLHQADFLSEYDQKQLIEWNSPIPEQPANLTVCSLFSDHVMKQPDSPAIFAWDGSMTYSELDQISTKVAAELCAFGVLPGTVVPFCMEKSRWAPIAALAILKVGAALVPTDSTWPQQRMRTILEATDTTIVVCSPDTRSCFRELAVSIFELSAATFDTLEADRSCPVGPSTKDVAFILFSSGSTGAPKGMVREHGTACIASIAHAEALHMDRNSRVLQFANHVFDVAMLDFFTTLVTGGCICIPSESDRRNDLAGFIRRSQANWALLTPTVAGMLDPKTVSTLRLITLGGEAITSELLNKWLGHCRVSINYGSAEVDVTQACDIDTASDPANIGKRLPCCVTYIVDPDNVGKVLPIGAVGELVISGPTLAREYLNNHEKTAASFIPAPVDWYRQNPDGSDRSWMKRAYRMGDLLQQQRNGSFRFIGRRDFQIKIHGQKVELGEIEAQLSSHPRIDLCAVLYPQSGPLANRLVAVIQLHGTNSDVRRRGVSSSTTGNKFGIEDIKRYLSERVPSYMLPQVSILSTPMPLTATMKVDRTRLKAWISEDDAISASSQLLHDMSTTLHGTPLSPDEVTATRISTIIADLVAVKQSQIWCTIHGHNNAIADIGVDSVQIMRLSHAISKRFGIKVSVECLTDTRLTVRGLARLVDMAPRYSLSEMPLEGATDHWLRKKFEEAVSSVRTKRAEDHMLGHDHMLKIRSIAQRNVFLTGATGYLGIQILRSLLESRSVGTVSVLVRSADVSQARERLRTAAATAKWSIEAFEGRIDLWLGDLSRPQLGLQDSTWARLTDTKDGNASVDAIIHCGAIVDWTKSYNALEAANVSSTLQLLNATLGSNTASSFIYISGGQYFQPGSDAARLDQLFAEAAAGNGYTQTKFIAEQVVEAVRARLKDASDGLQIHVVKPAYLIGSAHDGLANIDDYLWRLVLTAVRLQIYNGDEAHQWLLAADTRRVAGTIADLVSDVPKTATAPASPALSRMQTSESETSIKILDGIPVDLFWTIVGKATGCTLRAVAGTEWSIAVKSAMEHDANHPLWPLLEAFEKNQGLLTGMHLPAATMLPGVDDLSTLRPVVGDSIRRNLQHLVEIGFLPANTQ